jgi:hypothetical protein
MASEWDWVNGPKATGGGVPCACKDDAVQESGSDMVRSEDGSAAMVTDLPNGEKGVGLERWKDTGGDRRWRLR